VNLHALHEPTAYAVDMLDQLVGYERPRVIADDLMDIDDDTLGPVLSDAHGFDVRIDHRPLARPVRTNRDPTVHSPAFHAIGPIDVRVQRGQDSVNISTIEGSIERREAIPRCQQSLLLTSGVSFPRPTEQPSRARR
jgi:hypothetical protein